MYFLKDAHQKSKREGEGVGQGGSIKSKIADGVVFDVSKVKESSFFKSNLPDRPPLPS